MLRYLRQDDPRAIASIWLQRPIAATIPALLNRIPLMGRNCRKFEHNSCTALKNGNGVPSHRVWEAALSAGLEMMIYPTPIF
jgi:hypothetical protein